MTKQLLCETIYKICEEEGYDFLLLMDDYASMKVTPESSDVLRRMSVLYEKDVQVSIDES